MRPVTASIRIISYQDTIYPYVGSASVVFETGLYQVSARASRDVQSVQKEAPNECTLLSDELFSFGARRQALAPKVAS